ncbi:hypothetical protein BWL13_00241 [Microbacterium oleivorans]|uniref:Uncharacterized protein n=2 Tax=Microbacterium oleivorans TaxID=273677 RepID=A0A031FT14_9MICO|nr:hypothetical protein BWL13_00241 [Microbacterium oleivorans]EZP27452.1 hypothetical protein BW34_01439 [Microbacterium oleivorans]
MSVCGGMSSDPPDWTIRIPASEERHLTGQQQKLFQDLEAELPPTRGRSHDISLLAANVAPIVRALSESGLTAEQIADNSRLRPPFVKAILDGGA